MIPEDSELQLNEEEERLKERLERYAYLNHRIYHNYTLSHSEVVEWFKLNQEFKYLLD